MNGDVKGSWLKELMKEREIERGILRNVHLEVGIRMRVDRWEIRV